MKRMHSRSENQERCRYLSPQKGFTIIELMVAMVIGAIVLAGIYASHSMQQKTYRNESMILNAQQNVRGALHMVQMDLMMAGYDRSNSGLFGVVSITNINGNSAVRFTADNGAGGNADNGIVDAGETIEYSMFDSPDTTQTGVFDLAREVVPPGGADARVLLAEGIEAFAVAYAYDADGDGQLDFVNTNGNTNALGIPIQDAGENVIWAIDTDSDNDLDTSLDDNNDGVIDQNDTIGGTSLTALGLTDNIPVDQIRAMRIWLLARTKGPLLSQRGDLNRSYYIPGRTPLPLLTFNDNRARRLLIATVQCRNLGL
jgi:type IV pilus assembly protein PilW